MGSSLAYTSPEIALANSSFMVPHQGMCYLSRYQVSAFSLGSLSEESAFRRGGWKTTNAGMEDA
jgi:hypothetical protein